MKNIFIAALVIIATSASALTNTNLVASAYYLRVDSNGVITGPLNFKTTNNIASASLLFLTITNVDTLSSNV
ncbi:MAG: hypothetical protein V2A34_02445, partial [Lentisphaerota bacterium]